jgi:hypothetical protein
MEKALESLTPRARLKIKVTPRLLREAADRLDAAAKTGLHHSQELEMDFTRSVSFVYEPETTLGTMTSFSTPDPTVHS